jgi:predicted aminopeptidase
MTTAALVCLLLSGCGTVGFYSQAIAGQTEILSKARPIDRVVRNGQTADKVKQKLAVVQEARAFAKDHLDLPAQRAFDRYTDLGRRHVSWVVFAAPEFSVEGKEWWYPVVGHLEYRGFFDEKAAWREANRWQARGYDVYVGGVDAYSTLGWFRDPILNTSLHRTDPEVAELIFHELSHVKVFLPGDTDFNEAFATATAEEGVHRWLRHKDDRAALVRYEASLAKDREIIHLLLSTRAKLNRLYLDPSIGVALKRQRKAAIFQGMRAEYALIRQRWRGDSRYDRTFAKPWNNARLNTVATYYDLVPSFQRLLKREHGDLKTYYAAVARMRNLSKEERRTLLR